MPFKTFPKLSTMFRWALAQTAILLVMGAWQMRHLKSFFEAKKLV